jgi:hypothetical protein
MYFAVVLYSIGIDCIIHVSSHSLYIHIFPYKGGNSV